MAIRTIKLPSISWDSIEDKPQLTQQVIIQQPEEDTTPRCSPYQIRKLLVQLDLRDFVEQAIKNSSNYLIKDGWEYATEFRADDPFVIQMGVLLGKTEEEIADLLTIASTL